MKLAEIVKLAEDSKYSSIAPEYPSEDCLVFCVNGFMIYNIEDYDGLFSVDTRKDFKSWIWHMCDDYVVSTITKAEATASHHSLLGWMGNGELSTRACSYCRAKIPEEVWTLWCLMNFDHVTKVLV